MPIQKNMRYVIEIAFMGKKYAGWQIQKNALSVQAVIDKSLSALLRCPIYTLGAGRTDAGVHATQLFAHFDFGGEIPLDFMYRLNAILPRDISIMGLYKTEKPDFNARFDAVRRRYSYHIISEKNPFLDDYTWYHRFPLAINKMNEAAAILPQYNDFAAFAKTGSDNQTTICRLDYAYWDFAPVSNILPFSAITPVLSFHIQANRFLRGMVRAITGTLVKVGEEKISIDEFREIINSKSRTKARESAPAEGLFLTGVDYPLGYLTKIQ